jgi:hypothetical protein
MSAPLRIPNTTTPATANPSASDGSLLKGLPHTTGFSDQLGDRQLVFDPAAGTSLEVLRFKNEFGELPEFEAALLARVEVLSHLQHPSLATIHTVGRHEKVGLVLVSKHVPGKRVSELLPKAQGPAFALELIRLVTPALAALHRAGDGVTHGALSADRIVVTRDGRLVVVEHVLGSALENLGLSRNRLIELGLPVPAGSDPVRLDARTDMAQLGFIALSLLLGRRLSAADYPDQVPALLDEFAQVAGSPAVAAKLRSWLERAMQLSPKAFASAKDAQSAFHDLPDDADLQVAAASSTLVSFPLEATSAARGTQKPLASSPAPRPAATPKPAARSSRMALWVAGGLALIGAGAGTAFYLMPYMRPAAQTVEIAPPPAPIAPLSTPIATVPAPTNDAPTSVPPAAGLTAATGVAAGAVAPAEAVSTNGAPQATTTPAPTPVQTGPRFGGVTVTSVIELQVFENGKLLGSTAAPLAVNEGTRNLELVNEATGFRHRQSVNVKAGQMTTLNIAVPNGRISVNAVPWAEVEIDGKPAGETPIANFSLPIGSHEISFRHPQLGLLKQTVVVKVDGQTRVTQIFEKK